MIGNIKRAAALSGGLLLMAPMLVGAQGGVSSVSPNANFNIATFVNAVLNWAFGLLIVIAVLFVIYAAFLYLTAAGDEEKTKKAKSYIVYAVIALVVGALARAVVAIVTTFLQTT